MDSDTLGIFIPILVMLATLPITVALAWVVLRLVLTALTVGGRRITI